MKKVFFSYLDVHKNNTSEILQKVAKEAAKQENEILTSQLNEFISRGLLVVEVTQPMLVTSFEVNENNPGYEVRIERGVRLVLKDQEYIEKLERENTELKNKLNEVKKLLVQLNETELK